MQREGYRESTVRPAVKALKAIARRADLLDPEAVKAYLARAEMSEARKEKVVDDLARFYRHMKIPFAKPGYRAVEHLPFVPLEGEIDQLISALGPKTATFLQLIKESAARPGEAWNLRWVDIDYERSCVTVAPEKNSKPRQRKISSKLLAMLKSLPATGEYLFRNPKVDSIRSLDDFRRHFEDNRRRAAKKLQNPRLNRISFKTLRHWKATLEYHRTKDILHVMRLLGHRNIQNTLIYTHLVNFEGDEYACKTAKTVEDATRLVEAGFEYVTEIDTVKLFRKRK
jgi:integrase